ncbi:MAG: protein-L-isoaspartate O-methyltransferase [Neisseriaceae bacterium]
MDYVKARYYMVEQQIRPWDVLDPLLLEALSEIPREKFVLPHQLEFSYAELALSLKNGSKMLEPKLVARLIQALELDTSKSVLEIGTGSGYATAVLARLSKQVDSWDKDEEQLRFAQRVIGELALTNVSFQPLDGLRAASYTKAKAEYDAIYIGGALHHVPQFLLDQLKPGGKLVAIVGLTPLMHATLYTKEASNIVEAQLFETNATYLEEEPASIKGCEFVF